MRCVEDRDKSFALGLTKTFLALFGSIPYPLLFGYISDQACLIWEKSCGKQGNCWYYDANKFRQYLHLTAVAFMIGSSFFDLFVIYYSYYMKNMYDDEEERPKEMKLAVDANGNMSEKPYVISGNESTTQL